MDNQQEASDTKSVEIHTYLEEQLLGEKCVVTPLIASLKLGVAIEQARKQFQSFLDEHQEDLDAEYNIIERTSTGMTIRRISKAEYSPEIHIDAIIAMLSPSTIGKEAMRAVVNRDTCRAFIEKDNQALKECGLYPNFKDIELKPDGFVGPAKGIWQIYVDSLAKRKQEEEAQRIRIAEQRLKREALEKEKKANKRGGNKKKKQEPPTLTTNSTDSQQKKPDIKSEAKSNLQDESTKTAKPTNTIKTEPKKSIQHISASEDEDEAETADNNVEVEEEQIQPQYEVTASVKNEPAQSTEIKSNAKKRSYEVVEVDEDGFEVRSQKLFVDDEPSPPPAAPIEKNQTTAIKSTNSSSASGDVKPNPGTSSASGTPAADKPKKPLVKKVPKLNQRGIQSFFKPMKK
ncbi:hypothetical protein DASB73_011150 [Starmerella bacillaris]|uniref:DNA polymerase delta subunit 3 n=1 Tax=Starmerella bacillaris TaxID=1247836 RepID=A0AAV5RGE0_STABA|nr:hypothetical protein DASB73_011150 [Starmerella bacillaris]